MSGRRLIEELLIRTAKVLGRTSTDVSANTCPRPFEGRGKAEMNLSHDRVPPHEYESVLRYHMPSFIMSGPQKMRSSRSWSSNETKEHSEAKISEPVGGQILGTLRQRSPRSTEMFDN